MTDLLTRGITRETMALEPCKRRKLLVIRLEVGGKLIRIKEKGRRSWHSLTIEQAYRLAIHNTAAEIRQAKKDAREARKAGRTS